MQQHYDERPVREWFVAFSDAPAMIPGQKLLKKGFRHVRAFGLDEESGHYLLVDPGWDGMVVSVVPHPEQLMAQCYVRGPVLKVQARTERIYYPRVLMVCTSQICHLIGFNLLVHTPWRLFCALKKRGAESLVLKGNYNGQSVRQ